MNGPIYGFGGGASHHTPATRTGVAYCQRCHDGDCYANPTPHTWVDQRDDPTLPDQMPDSLIAKLAQDHPCACDCAIAPATRASAAPGDAQGTGPAPEAGASRTDGSAGTTGAAPASVPEGLIELAYRHYSMHGQGLVANILAAVLPAHEAMVRAKVAEELRADADAHRRIVAKKPSQYDEARLARAKTLDDAAARITRGGVCEHWWEVRSLTGPPAPYGPCTKCGTPHPGGQA